MPLAARADGDTLPNPVLESPNVDPEPQSAIPNPSQNNSVTTTPDQDLPPPSNGIGGTEDPKLIVNKPSNSDDVFLPAPAAQDNVTYTPMGNPVVPNSVYDTTYVKSINRTRPAFSLYAGYATRNYPETYTNGNTIVDGEKPGLEVGVGYRLLGLANALFLNLYASASYIHIGDVASTNAVREWIYHYGPELELDVSRRLTFFGSVLERGGTIKAQAPPPGANNNAAAILGETGKFQLGGGVQYDFYVIPHASIGIRGYIERNYGSVMFTMSIEPDPGKRLSIENSNL